MKSLFILLSLLFAQNIYAQKSSCNCCTEKHAEFDFWVGEWTVTNADESIAGNSIIDKIQDNCVLRENWTSTSANYSGTSSNFYNYKDKQWEQIWIDNQGQSLHLKGNLVGNQMILQTDEETNAEGKQTFNRVTWTKNEDGTVRQLWEVVTSGSEISVAFDGLYKKK